MATLRVTDKLGLRSERQSRAIRVGDDGYVWHDEARGRHHREDLDYKGRKQFRDEPGDQWRLTKGGEKGSA